MDVKNTGRIASGLLAGALGVMYLGLSGCMDAGTDGTDTQSATNVTNPSGGATPNPTSTIAPPFVGGGGSGGTTMEGTVGYDSQLGTISGTAYIQNNPSTVLTVEIYINGPIGSGTMLTSMLANESSVLGNVGYSYTPAGAYIDSTPRKLYVYEMTAGGTPTLIGGAAIDYFAGPDAKGLAYYNANLKGPLVTSCQKCHQSNWGNYYTARQQLGLPSPISGGTATTNTLYMKPFGVNHSGGNVCQGTTICTDIAAWWGMDFGK